MKIFFENSVVEKEYYRWWKVIGENDIFKLEDSDAIGIEDILKAHFLIIDFFYSEDYGIGGIGPRDTNLLESSIYRQFVSFGDIIKWTSREERIATLIYGLIKDHPFHDANKHTALLILLYSMLQIKKVPKVKQKELEELVLRIAENKLNRYARYKSLLKKRLDDPEVIFIADYIRRNFRRIEHVKILPTYRELENILKNHGFYFCDFFGNYVHICKDIEEKSLFRKSKIITKKITKIGFPGYKKQVSKEVLRQTRKVTGMTLEAGFDSKVFFGGSEPIYSLIDTYEAPLRRLANK